MKSQISSLSLQSHVKFYPRTGPASNTIGASRKVCPENQVFLMTYVSVADAQHFSHLSDGPLAVRLSLACLSFSMLLPSHALSSFSCPAIGAPHFSFLRLLSAKLLIAFHSTGLEPDVFCRATTMAAGR
jgi:hypothetical protein